MNGLAYRYADANNFLKMLDSQELWFTDLRNMNDWDEYAAGFRIAKQLITEEFPDHIHVLENISREQLHDDFMMLICSLSKDGDCLSMWRGYGENGSGAAVGFSTHEIQSHHLFKRYLDKLYPIQGAAKFYPVIYSEEDYKTLIRHYISRVFTLHKDTLPDEIPAILAVRSSMLESLLARLCTLYKNDFFEDEKEIRGFIEISKVVDPYTMEDRNTDFGVALYHKICTSFQGIPSIKEVVLGPRYEESDEYVRSKLDAVGLREVSIRRSRGTYR